MKKPPWSEERVEETRKLVGKFTVAAIIVKDAWIEQALEQGAPKPLSNLSDETGVVLLFEGIENALQDGEGVSLSPDEVRVLHRFVCSQGDELQRLRALRAQLERLACHAQKDGDCSWEFCPQLRDGEPERSGRHCPLDYREQEDS